MDDEKRLSLVMAFLDLIGVLNKVGHAVVALRDEPPDEEISQALASITTLLGCQGEQQTASPDEVLSWFEDCFFQFSCDLTSIVLPLARTELEGITSTSPVARKILPLVRLLLDDQEQADPN